MSDENYSMVKLQAVCPNCGSHEVRVWQRYSWLSRGVDEAFRTRDGSVMLHLCDDLEDAAGVAECLEEVWICAECTSEIGPDNFVPVEKEDTDA